MNLNIGKTVYEQALVYIEKIAHCVGKEINKDIKPSSFFLPISSIARGKK